MGAGHGQALGRFLFKSRKDAGIRGHVSAGARRQRDGVGTRAYVSARRGNNLDVLSMDQGRMQEAEAMYRRVLECREKVWGTGAYVDAGRGQQPRRYLCKSRQDAGSRGHVSVGAGREEKGVGTKAQVNAPYSQQSG